jgi:hypothetical protein
VEHRHRNGPLDVRKAARAAGCRASVRAVRRGTERVVIVGLLLAVAAACSRAVPGTPTAAFPTSPVAASPTTVPDARAIALVPDVVRDECLLDAVQFGALLGRPVRSPQQSVVRRDDGSRTAGCAVSSADGSPTPLAAINVYRARSGTAAQFVRGSGGRVVPGAGDAATVLDTASGPTLQVARGPFLVTLAVTGHAPDDEAWRAAATAALRRLPG